MEPLTSAIGAVGAVRLTPGTADLATLFKDGRVVAGEVLETFTGGSVVLGIGGQRIPAESHVDLQLGQRFLATVENADGQIVLRLAPDDLGESSPLVRALRMVVGKEMSLGSMLAGLTSLAGDGSVRSPSLTALLADLKSYGFTPDDGGESLRALVHRSGLRYESALLAAADGDHSSAWLRSAVASELATRWVASDSSGSDLDGPTLRSTIVKLLLGAVTDPNVASSTELLEVLRRAIDERASGSASARVRAVIERALGEAHASPDSADRTALLRWLLGAPSDDRVRSLLKDVAKRTLDRDLKARLLDASSELDDGPARELVQRALASLETDQLMNVARRRFEQPWHFSLSVPDAQQWVTAQFLHLPTADQDTHGRSSADETSCSSHRLMLGIDFSRLGPIRADLLLRERDLIVRLTVERPETALALQGLVKTWRADLAVGGRAVHVVVTEAPNVDVALHAVAPDVRFLAEHHLMDVSG